MCSQVLNRAEPRYATQTIFHHHFSKVASRYHDFRTTDSEPITLIYEQLKELTSIEAVDIGCGPGRYDLLLYESLGDKLRLTCVDANADMLETLDKYLKNHGISNFTSMCSRAEKVPVPSNTLDCVFTFNAIHHFNLPEFLQESARTLKSGGYLFIYTRLCEQNRRNIWGQHFPEFHRKETRLHTLDTLTQTVAAVPTLRVKSIELFKYKRMSTLSQLAERVKARHYSTFCLYSPEELEEATAGFVQKINDEFNGARWIHWFDENVLFTIRKEG